MRFKIVSVGWECADFLERTLRSIESQTVTNYDVMIVDDASSDGTAEFAEGWCAFRSGFDSSLVQRPSWNCHVNTAHRGAVWNQHAAIWLLDPEDDDVVVWLDLDGDQFAHPRVLEILTDAYSDSTLLTYGTYRPEPDLGTCPPVLPYPADVVAANSYRAFHRSGGGGFNHLRTMRGSVAKAITPELLSWADGSWYEAGSDYLYMINGLELAGGRYKCMEEVLCIYNNANPRADNLTHPDLTNRCVADLLRRQPLEPLRD